MSFVPVSGLVLKRVLGLLVDSMASSSALLVHRERDPYERVAHVTVGEQQDK